MKNLSTLFLRIVVGLGGLFVFLFMILVGSEVIPELIEVSPPWFYIPVLGALFVSLVPFYYVLWQTFRLLHFIDHNTAFSILAVKALKRIKYAATVMGVLYVAILPLLYLAAQADDAPGLIAIGIVLTGTAVVVATFASVLQLVLQSAIAIKKENDLTV